MPELSVIIVTWNNIADIERCLSSIAGSGTQTALEVLVIDNASSDGTAALVREKFPETTVLLNRENTGFAAANNQAMRESGGRLMMLLNPDTRVLPGSLDALVAHMEQHPDVWACGPAVFNGDGTPQYTGVRFPGLWNLFAESLFLDRVFPHSRIFGRHKELYRDQSVPRDVDYVQGSCLLVRRDGVGRVGMLDESFFMYFEETDWCFRMKEAGGRVHFVPDAGIIHYGGGMVGHYDETRILHYHRSLLRFNRKHSGPGVQRVARAILVMRTVIRIPVWAISAILARETRSASLSSLRGYVRVLLLLTGLRS